MRIASPGFIALIIFAATALIIYFILQNKGDRKNLLKPDSTDDAVTEQKMDQERRREQL